MKSTAIRLTTAHAAAIRKIRPVASPYDVPHELGELRRQVLTSSRLVPPEPPSCSCRAAAHHPAGEQALDDQVLHPGREHRAEHRDPDGTTQAAEERDRRAGRADLADVDGVLYGEHQVLHHHAHAEAHREHAEPTYQYGVVWSIVPSTAEAGGAGTCRRAPGTASTCRTG